MGSAPQGGPKPPPGKASAVCGRPGAQGEAQSLKCGWLGSQEPHLNVCMGTVGVGGHGSRELRIPCSSSLADQGVGQSGPGSACLVQVGSTGGEQQGEGSSREPCQDHSSWQRCSRGRKVQGEVCGSTFLPVPPACNGGFKCGCRLFPEQLLICVLEIPGHMLGSSSASALRAPAGFAAGVWHKAGGQAVLIPHPKQNTTVASHVFAPGHARSVLLLSPP